MLTETNIRGLAAEPLQLRLPEGRYASETEMCELVQFLE